MRLVVELLVDGERRFANWILTDLNALEENGGRCWVDCPGLDGYKARAQLLLDDEENLG